MASRDLYSNVKATPALNSQTVAAAAVVGAIIDTQGFESLAFLLQSATITDGASYTPKLDHGDAANLSDAAVVAAADLPVIRPSVRCTQLSGNGAASAA